MEKFQPHKLKPFDREEIKQLFLSILTSIKEKKILNTSITINIILKLVAKIIMVSTKTMNFKLPLLRISLNCVRIKSSKN